MTKKLKNHVYAGILFFVLSIFWMVFIFSMSAQNAEESQNTSNKVVDKVANVIVPDYKDMTEDEKEVVTDKLSFPIRKLAHYSEYGVLGILLALAITLCTDRIYFNIVKALIVIGIGGIYAVTDEWHQSAVPGRGPAIKDVLIDTSGVLTAVIILFVVINLILRRKEKNRSTEK